MTNSKQNQKCWNCAHFQLYTTLSVPETAFGDCRHEPKVGRLENTDKFNQYWPFIGDGTDFWCSKWKKTQLIPPIEPVSPRDPSWPSDWENWVPWNVRKSQNISCWSCNHYQREVEDPTEPGENTGQCRKNPVPEVLDLVVGLNSDTLRGLKFVYAGSSFWCSCWERQQGNVPVDPGTAL